jgi:hypothetical protein
MAGDFSGCAARKKNRAQSVEYNPSKIENSETSSVNGQKPLTTRGGLRVYKIVILGDGGVGKSGGWFLFLDGKKSILAWAD